MTKKLQLSDMIKFQPTHKKVKDNMLKKIKATKKQEQIKDNE